MCGFAGYFDPFHKHSMHELHYITNLMTEALVHRGPDDAGIWGDEDSSIGLGHRRLSIVDLSDSGHQPMHSSSNRYVVAFNGEIYNFLEIRADLEQQGLNPNWRGNSDTEVLLAAIEAWGLSSALERFVGMFAFALWDSVERELILARDRMGEKPLYYGRQLSTVFFASELKAFRRHPRFKATINTRALDYYLRTGYIPGPYTIYQDAFKLLPGSILKIRSKNFYNELVPEQYWRLSNYSQTKSGTVSISEAESVEELDRMLRRTVRQQMVADVPLGAFLSGGIDSSTIVACMQAESTRAVKTFSIGFAEEGYNEAPYAKKVAHYLGTEHTELYVSAKEAMGVIPLLSKIFDEPFADSSQIPTLLVSTLAKQHVTVSLSGDAGDEVFGGYTRYLWAERLWKQSSRLPISIRNCFSRTLHSFSEEQWNHVYNKFSWIAPYDYQQTLPGNKIHKLADALLARSSKELYKSLICQTQNHRLYNWGESGEMPWENSAHNRTNLSFVEQMMYWDSISYLPDDILVKVDRAAMHVSLETRVPFLDHRIVEFAWKLPLSYKIKNGTGKQIVRKVLSKYIPESLINRPKMGFGIPLGSWLRTSLFQWGEELLNEQKMLEQGYFNVANVRSIWQSHHAGKGNYAYVLWNILMFQSWLHEQNID